MEYNYSKIGDRIKKERKKLGYSQDDLLNSIRDKRNPTFGRNTLSKLENGDPDAFCAINVAQLMALCEEFDCSISYLLGEYKERNYGNKFICEYTGLWEESLKVIQKEDSESRYLLNALILSSEFDKICSMFTGLLETMYRIKQLNDDSKIYHGRFIYAKDNIDPQTHPKLHKIKEDEVLYNIGCDYAAYQLGISFGNFIENIRNSKSNFIEKFYREDPEQTTIKPTGH